MECQGGWESHRSGCKLAEWDCKISSRISQSNVYLPLILDASRSLSSYLLPELHLTQLVWTLSPHPFALNSPVHYQIPFLVELHPIMLAPSTLLPLGYLALLAFTAQGRKVTVANLCGAPVWAAYNGLNSEAITVNGKTGVGMWKQESGQQDELDVPENCKFATTSREILCSEETERLRLTYKGRLDGFGLLRDVMRVEPTVWSVGAALGNGQSLSSLGFFHLLLCQHLTTTVMAKVLDRLGPP